MVYMIQRLQLENGLMLFVKDDIRILHVLGNPLGGGLKRMAFGFHFP